MQDSPRRYQRQTILPVIGAAGQAKLAAAHVLIVGLGALGGTIAEQLARAGIGYLRLVDRDVVDETNLHRQVLFSESDASDGAAKAAAAAARLKQINASITLEPVVSDVHAGNIEDLAGLGARSGFRVNVILDGTDNAETRYLINDVAVKHGVPWVYGACVATEGRVMAIAPGRSPCLRCIFPEPPQAGELATCDTAGVLGPAAACVAALQAATALRLLVEPEAATGRLLAIDAWTLQVRSLGFASEKNPDCPACGRSQFEFLAHGIEAGATVMCGKNAVQVRSAAAPSALDLRRVARQLQTAGNVQQLPYLVRCVPHTHPHLRLSVFADGRTLVEGTSDLTLARTLVARYVGA